MSGTTFVTPASEIVGDATPEQIDEIKQMRRADPIGRSQWEAYCEIHGDNVRDPARHSTSFIAEFVDKYADGERWVSPTGSRLGEFIKEGQRKSKHFKEAWHYYCEQKPRPGQKPENDPLKHDTFFLVGFLDWLGNNANSGGPMMAAGPTTGHLPGHVAPAVLPALTMGRYSPTLQQIQMQQMQHMQHMQLQQRTPSLGVGTISAPPLKRMKGPPGGTGISPPPITAPPIIAPPPTSGAVEPLVQKVKAFQRQGQLQKEQWADFCDTYLSGVRDPTRHDSATLQSFLNTHGIFA